MYTISLHLTKVRKKLQLLRPGVFLEEAGGEIIQKGNKDETLLLTLNLLIT